MCVFERSGKWYISGKIKKDNGTYYSYSKLAIGCTGKKEAKEYERIFRKQYQDIQVSLRYKTFKEVGDEYLASLTSVKKSTLRTYTDLLDKLEVEIGDKKINLINKDILQKLIRKLEEKYSKEYVEKFYYIIRAVFNHAIDNDYLLSNPMNKVKMVVNKDEIKKEMDFWEPDEFDRFIKEVEDQELKVFYIFLYYMGTRRGEAMALAWKDIDFKNNVVKIYKTVSFKTKGVVYEVTTPKTKNSIRNVPMFKNVREALIEWHSEQKKIYGFNEECFVFGFNRPLPAERPRKQLVKTLKKINKDASADQQLKKIRIHDFRHSHASWLINNMGKYSYTDFDIAKRLGDTVQMLHETYAHQFKNAGMNIINSIEQDNDQEPDQQNKGKYDDLIELKNLLDIGVITKEDFDMKKKQILGL